MSRTNMVAVAALLGLLGAAMTVGWWAWSEMADVPISAHGWVALGLGATFSIMLGVGLMVLVWRSHKRGYDDEAGRD